MNLGRLRVFHAVARAGTIAAAADTLNFTPSAVSQQMTRLESEVGAALLVRTPRGVTLTQAGEALLGRAESILAQVRDAQAELDDVAGVQAGTLRLGSFPTATQTFVARALGEFRSRHPGVRVRLVDDEPHHAARQLHDRVIELAVVFSVPGRPIGLSYGGEQLAPDEALEVETLFEEPFVLVVPEGHALADRPVHLDDLRGERLIGHPQTPGHVDLVEACERRGFELGYDGSYCTDYLAVRSLVAAGQGIALVPALACAKPLDGVVVRRLEEAAPCRQVQLARPADGYLSPAAAAMTEVLREVAAPALRPRALTAA